MGLEIEKKFLVDKDLILKDTYQKCYRYSIISQGFLSTNKDKIVRIRTSDGKGYITIKGSGFLSHAEYEYQIPVSDASGLLGMCGQTIDKKRYRIPYGSHIWEVDFFLGENEGLVIAELELQEIDEEFEIPSWVTKDVTGDKRYYNNNLIQNPFKNWK